MSPVAEMARGIGGRSLVPQARATWWASGDDIRWIGWLFLVSGVIDLVWILSYPAYQLKVFGGAFGGAVGWMVKLQHPVIHWVIGWGFVRTRLWAWWGYLAYLLVACTSEIITQLVEGPHPVRLSMIGISLVFAGYVALRRHVFRPRARDDSDASTV